MATNTYINASGIIDINGNPLFIFTATTAAVNFVNFADAATGGSPTWTAAGADANIGFNFIPKGTGLFAINGNTISLAGNLATGGAVTFSGAFTTQFNVSANSVLTLPAGSHTAAVLDVSQTFTTVQIFGNNISIGGKQFNITAPANGDAIKYNSTSGFWENTAEGTTNVSEVDKWNETVVGTAATTVGTWTPPADGSFDIGLSFRVVTAATNVSLSISYTDATGVQTEPLLNAVSVEVGTTNFGVKTIQAKTTGAITVSMTAGTANQVYASGHIIEVS